MNLASIPQAYRNASRWREIFAVLSKHGLADLVSRFDLPIAKRWFTREGNGAPAVRREERIRRALEDLGPAFIKLGQALATRPDQVGVELAEELAKLQTSTPAAPIEAIRRAIEEDLGRPIGECFASFDDTPVASASIGQVHRARLATGEQVAVKVRRPGVEASLIADAEILVSLGDLAERLPDLRPYRPRATAEEFQRSLRRELDYREELRSVERFREAFDGDKRVRIPRPYPELSGARVLTLEWFDGRALDELSPENTSAERLSMLARHGAEVYLEMIFEHGLYHADPHPGNLLVLEGDVIGLLDFGMVGRIGEGMREDLEDVLMAVGADDPPLLCAALLRIGEAPPELDERAFAQEIAEFVDRFGRQDMGRIDLTAALTELFRIVRRRRVVLPAAISLLLKLLVMLEGTGRTLRKDFALLEALAPMQRRMALRRLSPMRQARKARRLFGEVELLAEELPRRVRDLLAQFQSGRFEVHLEHRGLEPSVNRLVLGLLTSALLVAGALMASRDLWPLYGVSAPGAVAFALAGLLGLRLTLAISKSGWLDSR
ncbi:MAG: ABC1 kinase family protein [Lacipirellulaceae bacterium]